MPTTSELLAAANVRAETDAMRYALRRVHLFATIWSNSPDEQLREFARRCLDYVSTTPGGPEPGTREYTVEFMYSAPHWIEFGRTFDHAEALEWADRWAGEFEGVRIRSRLVTDWEDVVA